MADVNSNLSYEMDLVEIIRNTEGDVIDEVHREWLEQQSPEHMEHRKVLLSDHPSARVMCLILEYRKATMAPEEFREWLVPLESQLLERKRKAEQQ